MFYLTENILTLRINQRYIDPGTRLNALHDFLNYSHIFPWPYHSNPNFANEQIEV